MREEGFHLGNSAQDMCAKWPSHRAARQLTLVTCIALMLAPSCATAYSMVSPSAAVAETVSVASDTQAGSLETAASRASDTGRTIAFSLIGLALSVAAVVLVFRRDFKEAIGMLAVGIIAVLLASPAGLKMLQDTVSVLFGSG